MNGAELLASHGILLQSARGPIPNLAELVVGEPIKGSWWSHPNRDEIFRVLNEAEASEDVVRMRLVRGKITLVHRRLWPALVRLEARFDRASLASIEEQHTASGAHRRTELPFPTWVPEAIARAAAELSEPEALAQLPECLRAGS
jgi:hypothetical protein